MVVPNRLPAVHDEAHVRVGAVGSSAREGVARDGERQVKEPLPQVRMSGFTARREGQAGHIDKLWTRVFYRR